MKEYFLDDNGFPLEVIKKGQYERVKLVQRLGEDSKPQGNRIYHFINKILSPYPVKKPFSPEILAKDILYGRKVWKCDVEQIPEGKNYKEKLRLADILVCADICNQSLRSYRYHCSAGLCLSDFLEVIPPSTAANIINAAVDPGIAKDLLQGKGLLVNTDSDSRSLAIEGIVLLPSESRQEIFQEMAKAQPSETCKFINLIGASWNNPASGLDGPSLIKANLDNNFSYRADMKIAEVMSELTLLREIVESAK